MWIAIIATHALVAGLAYFVGEKVAGSKVNTAEIEEVRERGRTVMSVAESFTEQLTELRAKLQRLAMYNATKDTELEQMQSEKSILEKRIVQLEKELLLFQLKKK